MVQRDATAALLRPAREESSRRHRPASEVHFVLAPPPPFRLDLVVWTLRRRAENIVDRWDGTTYRRILPLEGAPVEGAPVEVVVRQTSAPEKPRLRVTITGAADARAAKKAIRPVVERMFGVRIDLGGFYAVARSDARLAGLAEQFRGMRPPRFPTIFEGLVNGIACQQLSLTLGIQLLGRLARQCGLVWKEGQPPAYAFPRPEDLARLDPDALRPLGFSHQKSRAIVAAARAICNGQLDLESLADLPDDEAVARLRQLRGVGRWTAEYVLLRGLGRWHIFPGDDIGARNSLARWLALKEPLDDRRVRRVLGRWSGYGGLIYFHLLLEGLRKAKVLP